MLVPTIPGWKAETIGDDICWMKFGDDGRLYAINPEAGFFGVAPGTGYDTNPNAMDDAVRATRIFTNTALTDEGDVWWEGHDRRQARPRHRLARQRLDARVRDAGRAPERPLHRARSQCPSIAPEWEDPAGVPISAILFGGRRAHHRAARDRGVRLGARRVPRLDHGLGDDRRRQQGAVGELRFDPMAMLPFCGYNMADYFAHWLAIGKSTDTRQAAEDLLRQLVPPRRRRPLPVARLRREQPRAEVGVRARRR